VDYQVVGYAVVGYGADSPRVMADWKVRGDSALRQLFPHASLRQRCLSGERRALIIAVTLHV
jgi:hypothetical protein